MAANIDRYLSYCLDEVGVFAGLHPFSLARLWDKFNY